MENLFNEEFYKRAIAQEGVDYNFYGDWQRSYAKMVIAITDIIKEAANNKQSLLLDVGCACGVTLKGFREISVFGNIMGVDISDYMITLGKKTHEFTDDELRIVDITQELLPVEDNSVTLLHCTHTLEHIPKENLNYVLKEFKRVLSDSGYGFIMVPAIKPGNSKETVGHEETHFIVETMNWWKTRLAKFFAIDNTIRKRFKESKFSPTGNEKTFYDYYNKGWTIFGLTQKKGK
jgi:ubiquinone/menaquinone biosynthesis C-methylase UbiE